MKHYFLIAAMFALAFTSCGSKDSGSKTLILYYSQTGTTEKVAQELQSKLNADMELIGLENPYSGTYGESVARVAKERESGVLPELLPLKADIAKYDTIFLGYPIWFGTYAMPIASLVKEYDFEGKHIVTFCTFGSGGLEAAIQDLKNTERFLKEPRLSTIQKQTLVGMMKSLTGAHLLTRTFVTCGFLSITTPI